MAKLTDSTTCNIFNHLSSQFSQLLYKRTEKYEEQVNKLLNELNSLDYRYSMSLNPTKAVLLVNQCCTMVPPEDGELVRGCFKLIVNLVNRQQVKLEGVTLWLAVEWCLKALKNSETTTTVEGLTALEALIRNNTQNLQMMTFLTNYESFLLSLAQDRERPLVVYGAITCLEACTVVTEITKPKNKKKEIEVPQHLEICANIFLEHLTRKKLNSYDDVLYSKILILCIEGLQNVVIQNHNFLLKNVGLLLGIIKSYMVYGIKDIPFVVPEKIMSSILNIAEPSHSITIEKKGGKLVKQRKHKTAISARKDTGKGDGLDETHSQYSYVPTCAFFDVNYSNLDSQLGNKLKTSDSDFSDNEKGREAKLGITCGRVRQAALNFFVHIIRLMDKPTIFSYWSSFISENSSASVHSLTTCILKDPSPKGRMAALNVLLALLTSSKLYLSQAESSERNSAFTPFSVLLGSTLIDLHKCLSLALNENSIPVLTQVMKCLAALVQATPYHRLTSGIITKIIRNVKVYIKHRDATVQVASLIVLGCILASEPTVPETKLALLKQTNKSDEELGAISKPNPTSKIDVSLENDMEFIDFSSDEEQEESSICNKNSQVPWLLERCLFFLGVSVREQKIAENVPAPVKLESLQVMSAMTRNYFDSLMLAHLVFVTKALEISLCDKYSDLRLHAGRTVNFVGQAIHQKLDNADNLQGLASDMGITFWQTILNKPLLSLISEDLAVLRAVACDCLGSVGSFIFEHFSRNKQIVVITSLLGCCQDEDDSVKASAVRALAICVLYPSLREDSGFVVDVADTICVLLDNTNVTVKIKASWSLGNLSDVLVLSGPDPNCDDIPDDLLLNLLKGGLKIANDHEKVKANAARALGNLLQLITPTLIQQKEFSEITDSAIDVLIKNSTTGTNMKSRWNSCYAMGNILKNSCLYCDNETRSTKMFATLMDLVMNFRNFKVRINAALALSCSKTRQFYDPCYFMVWKSLLRALENTQSVEDFNEYNHRDNLVDQICLTFGYITTLLGKEDLGPLHGILIYHFDLFKSHMNRVLERLLPEKSSILLSAPTHLNNLSSRSLSNEEREVIQWLHQVFIVSHDI